MDVEKAIGLAGQYGVSTVLCILMVFVLAWVLKKVFDANAIRETNYAKFINEGMANFTKQFSQLSENIHSNTMMIQEVGRNMKDGFDAMAKADGYQREEHRELGRKVDEYNKTAENAREKIMSAINDNECQASKK